MARPIVVHADWDPEASVWVATTSDLRGLVTEAETIEALRAKLPGMILTFSKRMAIPTFQHLLKLSREQVTV